MNKAKRILSIILTLAALVSVISIGMVETNAADYEYAMFPMTTLTVTQGVGGSYSHAGTLAIDIAGKDSGIESAYAPFTGTITKIYNKFQVWLQSSDPVIWADGTIDYMTILVVHDNDTSDLYVGKKINQGERFFEEGTAGNATGNHIHLEVAKGKMSGGGWYKNSYGTWTITNAVHPATALFLSPTTVVKNGYGYNWKTVDPSVVNPFHDKTPANLGDNFFASMQNTGSSKFVVTNDKNVEILNGIDMQPLTYIWNFERQADGSYVIKNTKNNYVLNSAGAGKTDGTNVNTVLFSGADSEKWFIYKIAENQYALKPKHCNLVMDVYGGYSEDGTNIQLYTYNASSAQLFKINTIAGVTSADISVTAGDYKTSTSFGFSSKEAEATNYALTIYSGEKGNTTLYEHISTIGMPFYTISLPAGYYEACVEASNDFSFAKSKTISFKVADKPQTNADGWTYSEKLFDEINEENYEIQYKYTYDTVAAEAPDESYTKGDFVKTEFVNSGEAYWSAQNVTTSDSLVLVDYYFYHYCGGSTGNNANFTSAGNYVHFDSISKDKVYIASSHQDYDDASYTYYSLKWNDGSDAYCNSNSTCDGTNGTHGNRSCYWYKMAQYQPKVATNLYHFTKVTDWQSEAKSDVAEVSYRYKLKEGSTTPTTPEEPTTIPTEPTTPDNPLFMQGDVNRDGKLNIRDATLIQKYLAKMVTADDLSLLAADYNLDGKINIKDATTIQKKLAGLI